MFKIENSDKRTKLALTASLLGIVLFILISSVAPFREALFSLLFSKPFSRAAVINNVWLEPENYQITPPMVVGSDASASNGQYVSSPVTNTAGVLTQPTLALNTNDKLGQVLQAASSGFIEDFNFGVPTAPKPFTLSDTKRWIVIGSDQDGLITHNAGSGCRGAPNCEYETYEPIQAAHGPHCEPPFGNADVNLNIHTIPNEPVSGFNTAAERLNYILNSRPQYTFLCSNHMMTVMKSGTSQISFIPRYALDWSGGRTQTIEFDVNPFSIEREWWELYIAPRWDFTLSTHILSRHAVTFAMRAGVPQAKEIGGARPYYPDGWRRSDGSVVYHYSFWNSYCNATPTDPACGANGGDQRVRRHVKITFNSNNFNFSVVKPDGSLYTTGTIDWPVKPLPFTNGFAMFSHWSYNPTKDGPFTQNHANTPLTYGNPVSLFTYHWDNVTFDGPATPLMTAYPPVPGIVDTNTGEPGGKNPTDPITINVSSADLRNPVLWGMLNSYGQCFLNSQNRTDNTTCPDPTHTDQGNTQGWAQVSVNGSNNWINLVSVRPPGTDFVTEDNVPNNVQDTSMTFKAVLPAGSVHQGVNTVRFRAQNPSPGFSIDFFELQVDPNAEQPPANASSGPPSGGGVQPTINFTSPPTGTPQSGNVNVAVNASSPNGIATVEFYVDGALTAYDSTTPYNFSLDTRTLYDDTHTLLARVYDFDENSAQTSIPITTQNNNPKLPSNSGSVEIPFTVTDTGNYTIWSRLAAVAATGSYWLKVDDNPGILVKANPPTVTPTTPGQTTPPGATTTVIFDDAPGQQIGLNGQYPSGFIDWGTNQWFLSAPFGGFTTKSFSFTSSRQTSTFNLINPRIFTGFDAFNGGSATSTITISCTGNPTVTQNVGVDQLLHINTNWVNNCSSVTLSSTNGWNTNFDNLVFTNVGGTNPPATTAPTTAPTTPPTTPPATTPPAAGAFNCTLFIGYSQTNNWFPNFHNIVTNGNRYEMLWSGGGAAIFWTDPNYAGWSNSIAFPCATNRDTPDRLVLDVTHNAYLDLTASTAVSDMAQIIRNEITTARSKYPSARVVVLQPVSGGPNHSTCPIPSMVGQGGAGTNFRASINHPYIHQAIDQVVNGTDIIRGNDSQVSSCSDYADEGRNSVGHLSNPTPISQQVSSWFNSHTSSANTSPIVAEGTSQTQVLGLIGDVQAQSGTNWAWTNLVNNDTNSKISVNLTAGNHTLTLIGREANTRIDRLLVTNDLTFTPSGTGIPAVDTQAPTVGINQPQANQAVSGAAFNVHINASDDSSVSRVELLVDGNLVGSTTSQVGGVYTLAWNTTSLSEGTHNLVARAYDPANNVGTSATVAVNVDNIPAATAPPATTPPATATPRPSATVPGSTTPPATTPPATTAPTTAPTTPPSGNCSILATSWGAENEVQGVGVPLTVFGSGNCVGRTVNFQVTEADSLAEGGIDDPAQNQPASATFNATNLATTSWTAEWQDDCAGLCNPPEYFFVASIVGTSVTSRSLDPMLTTNKAPESSGGGSSGGDSGGGGGGGGGSSAPAASGVTGDLNGDRRVDILDISILLRNWGRGGLGDLNGDSRVNILDVSLLLRNWGSH